MTLDSSERIISGIWDVNRLEIIEFSLIEVPRYFAHHTPRGICQSGSYGCLALYAVMFC